MINLFRKFCILLTINILSGCSAMQASQSPNPVISPTQQIQVVVPSQLDMLMQYYKFLQEKTESELVQEFNTVKMNFMHNNSNGNRIRYILLLSLPNADFRNISDALSLLIEWPQNEQELTSMDIFRKLLTQLLTEQQHLTSTVRNFSEKLKAAEEHSEKLQKKVDDIKDMEKSLIRRESQSNIN
jgi:bacterioferritin (cytochrome b1)